MEELNVEEAGTIPASEQVEQEQVKRRKSSMDIVMSKLKRTAPKNSDFDISRSTTEVWSRVKYVIKTGLSPVDTLTGGIPFGRITEIYGLEGCLKTALLLRICGMANRKQIYNVNSFEGAGDYTLIPHEEAEVTVLYIDNETSLDDNNRLIVEGQKVDVLITDADTIDGIFKQIDTTIDALEEIEKVSEAEHAKSLDVHKKSVQANKKDKSKPIIPVIPLVRQFLVVVVDTIAATSTVQEMAAAWGAQDFPRGPKEIRAGFKKLVRRINHRNVALICANQVGDSFAPKARNGPKYKLPQESDFSSPGGKALKFYASLRVFMVMASETYKVHKASKFPDGRMVHLFTKKNRQIKPLRTARIVLLNSKGLDNTYSILEHILHLGVGAWGDTGITFDFEKYNINVNRSLQDADADEGGKVKLEHKEQWPEMYAKYKDAFDQLYEKTRQLMFESDSADFVGLEGDPDEDGLADIE